jgi:hypothetical protein
MANQDKQISILLIITSIKMVEKKLSDGFALDKENLLILRARIKAMLKIK